MEIPTDLVDTMAAPTDLVEQNQQGTEAILEDLTTRMTQALRQSLNQTPAVTYDTAAPIAIKLNGTNYALWSQIVEMYISGKDKLGYINGDLLKPELNDPTFRRWRTENSIVKGWLINSMDPSLVGNFIRFPTAKQVWESIATTYFDGNDKSQVYDLKRRVTRMKQNGESIEGYYNCLQGLWREIDYRRPNPMECAIDVQRHNTLLQEDRVYVFLDGLDDRLDKIRSDVLQLQPFPSVEQAYAYVRREDIRQSVMLETNGGPTASVMATKSGKQNQMLRMTKRAPGYAATGGSKNLSGGLGCSHCGNAKHTRETCFKLHGYPEWWNEFKAKKSQEANGGVGRAAIAHGGVERTAIAHAEPTLSLIPCVETKAETASNGSDQGKGCCYTSSALVVSTKQKDDDWIVDSGATDHMTYNPDDLDEYITPRRNNISNANGVLYPVTGAGTVQLSPSISLTNTLLVPSLTTKLISVGQATEDLNCIVLMYPHFCLFQDILTKKIIGRGNEEMGILPIHADEERDIRAVINVEREDDDDATGTPSEDMETKRAATVEEEMGVSVDMGEEDLIADLAVDTGDKEAEMENHEFYFQKFKQRGRRLSTNASTGRNSFYFFGNSDNQFGRTSKFLSRLLDPRFGGRGNRNMKPKDSKSSTDGLKTDKVSSEGTGGKMVFKPKDLKICWQEESQFWSIPEGDGLPVELLEVCWLDVSGEMRVTKGKAYEVSFKLSMNTEHSFGWEVPVTVMARIGKKGKYERKEIDLSKLSKEEKEFPPDKCRIEFKSEEKSESKEEPREKKSQTNKKGIENAKNDEETLYFGLYEVWTNKWKGGLRIHEAIVQEIPAGINDPPPN
ncbi:hypothetical protein POTOM_059890 [Populus tomentosa]|uniref:Retrotransposon Copia-like N-terminal domain-containing protein n=1 Tax=Populus tomentosa TaxID=118781 RepID=A0A8X7XSM2_POPTO|nr:hypothetical protein POTOM_059890 [Populus tomentosa]